MPSPAARDAPPMGALRSTTLLGHAGSAPAFGVTPARHKRGFQGRGRPPFPGGIPRNPCRIFC